MIDYQTMQQIRWTDRGNIHINRSQMHECRNWERGRAVSFLGVHKSDIVCSVSHLKHEIFVANVFKQYKPVFMDDLGTRI
jgi:hypothetical protein